MVYAPTHHHFSWEHGELAVQASRWSEDGRETAIERLRAECPRTP